MWKDKRKERKLSLGIETGITHGYFAASVPHYVEYNILHSNEERRRHNIDRGRV